VVSLKPREKEIEIEYEGQKAKVVIKRLTWGERNEVLRAAMGKLRMVGGDMPNVEWDQIAFMEAFVLKATKSAPFQLDVAVLRSLDPEIVDTIYKAAMELNDDLFRAIF